VGEKFLAASLKLRIL